MSNWQVHIAQLKILLLDFKKEIVPFWDTENHKEKKAQLQSIEKTITNLNKNNTFLPDDVRVLKFKLLKELDTFKRTKEAKNELNQLFAPFAQGSIKQVKKSKTAKQEVKQPRKHEEPTGDIKDLIEPGFQAGTAVLTRLYFGAVYRAVITSVRKIQFMGHANQEPFETPSGEAVAASGKSQNGWPWWGIKGQGIEFTLDYKRQKLV